VKFDDLMSLEDAIKNAAMARVAGIGIEPTTPILEEQGTVAR
jgi:hypothetical protein